MPPAGHELRRMCRMLGWVPEPKTAKVVSWHDWAGVVEPDNIDFHESDKLGYSEIERYQVSATSIFAEPARAMRMGVKDPEPLLLENLRMNASLRGRKMFANTGPAMLILPSREDLTDLTKSL